MKLIGITGPSGSGKSILGRYLAERSIPVIDADELYHSLLVPPSRCLDLIKDAFGSSVINQDGTLDRHALAGIVFSDAEKLELLNSTVLSVVIEEARVIISKLEKDGHKAVVFDAPTLIESGFNEECDLVVSVLSSADTRAKRIAERDGIDCSEATARIKAQKDDAFYKSHSDIVIINDGDIEAFREKASEIYDYITK